MATVSRRQLLGSSAVGMGGSLLSTISGQQRNEGGAMRQPNVVLVTSDQQRADHLAGHGFGLNTMPFLERIADGGRRFLHAYTTSPACVPARTSLLTGRFPTSTRVRQNSMVEEVVAGADLIDVFRRQGYSVHFAGKTHMYRNDADDWDSFDGPYWHDNAPHEVPADAKFEEWLRNLDHRVSQEPTPFSVERQYCYRATSGAIEAIEEAAQQDSPFFCWLSFPEPHNPYQAPDPYYSTFSPDEVPERTSGPDDAISKGGTYRWLRELIEEKRPGYDENWRTYRAVYCGMLRMLDDQVRRLVERLRELDEWDNTIFIYTSDHGDYVGEYGLQRKGAGMPECLMQVPLVITGPGIESADDEETFCSWADLFPTLCEAIGANIPLSVQGRSMWPVLTGDAPEQAKEEFASVYAERGFGGLAYGFDERPPLHFPYDGPSFDELNTVTQAGSTRMVRRGAYKLLVHESGRGELYDLDSDPAELHDRYDDPAYSAQRRTLTDDLLRWTIRVNDPLPKGDYTTKRAAHNWAPSKT